MKNNKAAALIFGQVLAIGILGIACVLLGVSRRDAIDRSENLQAELEASADREEGLHQDIKTKSAYIEELENRAPEIRTVEVEKVVEIEKVVEVPPENEYSSITMTENEKDLLWWILALEAKDQPDVGQRGVVEVIFNRVLSPEWPNTVEEVLTQKGQFDGYSFLKEYREGNRKVLYASPDEREQKNIEFVLIHGRTVLPEDYVFFASYKANGRGFLQIEDHYFARG